MNPASARTLLFAAWPMLVIAPLSFLLSIAGFGAWSDALLADLCTPALVVLSVLLAGMFFRFFDR